MFEMKETSSIKYIACLLMLPLAAGAIVIKSVRSKPKSSVTPIRVSPPGGGRGVAEQVIEMLNGDTLSGALLGYSFSGENSVVWKYDGARNDITFKPQSVARIQLQHKMPPNVGAKNPSRVHLRNGDVLIGELAMVNDEGVSLSTWYGGTLTIPREEVTHISPANVVSNAIYEGPNDMNGWSGAGLRNANVRMLNGALRMQQQRAVPAGSKQGWSFRDKAFYSFSSGPHIGRKVKFPDSVNIEFDLNWRGHFQLATYFYGDQMKPYSGSTYNLTLSPSSVYLQRMRNGSSQNIGNTNLNMRAKNKARFSIRVNRKKSTVTLVVDGQVRQQWTDSTGFAGKGDVLMFVNQGSAAMKLSDIRITEWDGSLPSPGGQSGRESKDELRLAGNNVLSGKIKWVRDGKVEFFFEATGAEQKIPLDKVERIRFAKRAPDAPELERVLPGTVRALLVDGGRLTFKLDEWNEEQVTGESEIFEEIDFRPAVFKTLEFNLDQQRSAEDDPFGF